MVDRILLIFNILFCCAFLVFVYFLESFKFAYFLNFIFFNFHFILAFILSVFIFNTVYIRFLYSRLYFIFNGVDDTYIFLKLKIMRKTLKSVFDISLILKIILIKQDKKTLNELFFYLKNIKISNKTIVELYSIFISLRDKEKAASLIVDYKENKNRWVRYCVALNLIANGEFVKLNNEIDFLKKYFLRSDPIFTIYFHYILKNSNLGYQLIEKDRLKIRDKYFKYTERLNAKHTKLLKSNLFFVVFYYIYDISKKDIFLLKEVIF
ncbi:hypothetical protein [Borrelia sp. HM]|uniref:hypothetical protein n=1 Tax=Borrelia sp. HM TaxID=1882662 RepID=UPI001C7E87A1|nr:hypothetical protein [Borrelia sp. HM]